MDKRCSHFLLFLLHFVFCGAFLGCSDSSPSSPAENLSSSESVTDKSSSSSEIQESGKSSSEKSSSSGVSEKMSSVTSAKTPEEAAAIAAIARSCTRDSLVADSLLNVYEKEGSFGKATTSLADCAYKMTFERLQGDMILPSDFERLDRDLDLNYSEFKKAFYKFWQDDFGVGLCNKDSANVISKNKDSLSTVGNYFICTDKREGFYSEYNWIRANDLQINAYKQDCDSADYRGINNATTGKLYVCDHGKWRYPMEIENECGLCGANNDGLVKAGSIFEYICDSSQWKINEFILKDSRDNKEYSTTKVAGLYWMMDNMQADTARFYWDSVSKEDFCPNGWRLPTVDEWWSLFKAMDNKASNASIMRLQGGALRYSSWWTSSEVDSDSVIIVSVRYEPMSYKDSQKFSNYGASTVPKTYPHSVRCVKKEL